ncbi:protein tumorous imaginal discs, mitochondrial [Triticum aestivum]|nr:protein tumorous imaginal discs, mitochondrial-like [Triticum aestivum]
MATWETPASLPTVAQTCRSFRRAEPQPNRNRLLHLLPTYPHAAASSIPSFQPLQLHHAVNRANITSGTRARRVVQIHLAIPFLAHGTPMAVAGGMALSLRVPSSSASPAVGRRQRAAVRCGATRARPAVPGGGLEEDHYRTLRLAPGASRGEVKRAFRRLALQYHPDVVRDGHQDDDGVDFQRINAAYQRVMSNIRETEARLEYWRRRYGLADEDLDRYRHYLNDEDEDDWFADL